jgi:hypothetical protein
MEQSTLVCFQVLRRVRGCYQAGRGGVHLKLGPRQQAKIRLPEGDMRTILLTDAGVRILLAAMTFIALLIGLLAPDELPSSGLLDWFPAPVLE